VLTGRVPGSDLDQLLDPSFERFEVPDTGLLLPRKLAEMLGVGLGDRVRVEVLEGRQPTLDLPVTALLEGYIGIEASVDLAVLNQALHDPPLVSTVNLQVDSLRQPAFFEEVKGLPAVATLIIWDVSRQNFRETVGESMLIMTAFYTGFASLIAFGVVYNSVRIALSERGRELASLRVLGFTKGEVAWILLGELALLTLASIPLGWLLGYGLAWLITAGLESELFRVPLVVERQTYGYAALIVILAAIASGLLVARRIAKLDLIAVLKTRE
jgi:putative ABC transport system permease protein